MTDDLVTRCLDDPMTQLPDDRNGCAGVSVHDPYVKHWWELEKQDTYPATDRSLKQFFRNQEKLKDLRVQHDMASGLKGVDGIILAVRHEPYMSLDPEKVVEMTGRPVAVVDCFGILNDFKITKYFELGCEVKGLGRGHIQRIKEEVRSQR